MTLIAVGRYSRGHSHRWIITFQGETEDEARAKMFDFVGGTYSMLQEFHDFQTYVKDRGAA